MVGGGSGFAAAAEATDTQKLAFFETKIRPVLVEHCYKCHASTSEKLKAGVFDGPNIRALMKDSDFDKTMNKAEEETLGSVSRML